MKKHLTAALLGLALILPAAHAAPETPAKDKKPAAAAKATKPAAKKPANDKPFAAAVKQPAANNDKPVAAAVKQPAEPQAAAAPQTAAPAASEGNALDAFMRGTKDLQANFTQTIYSKRGTEASEGKMWVAKPGKFYWDYQRPNPQKIISNGKKVYHYDIDLEQISIRGRDELVGDVAVELLNGEDNISRNYNIDRVVKNLTPPRLQKWVGNGVTYRLKPKTRQEEYDALWVILDGNSISAVMIDGGSSQTILNFTNMKRNVGIPASQFEFTPPKGVDVVGK